MHLDIISRDCRHGTVGFLGIETFKEHIMARFIFKMKKYDTNLLIFASKNFHDVLETESSVGKSENTYLIFSVKLEEALGDPRKLLKSVVNKLKKVQGDHEEMFRPRPLKSRA